MRSGDGMTAASEFETARDAGMTLLEVSIALVLLTIVVGVGSSMWLRTQDLYNDQLQQYVVDDAGWRISERIVQELRTADPSSVLPLVLVNSDNIQFQRVVGVGVGGPILGSVVTIRFELVGTETANGLDDNGDGRIDEGRVVLIVGPADPIVLGENALTLDLDSTASGVSVTVITARLSAASTLIQRSFARNVSFRQ